MAIVARIRKTTPTNDDADFSGARKKNGGSVASRSMIAATKYK